MSAFIVELRLKQVFLFFNSAFPLDAETRTDAKHLLTTRLQRHLHLAHLQTLLVAK